MSEKGAGWMDSSYRTVKPCGFCEKMLSDSAAWCREGGWGKVMRFLNRVYIICFQFGSELVCERKGRNQALSPASWQLRRPSKLPRAASGQVNKGASKSRPLFPTSLQSVAAGVSPRLTSPCGHRRRQRWWGQSSTP